MNTTTTVEKTSPLEPGESHDIWELSDDGLLQELESTRDPDSAAATILTTAKIDKPVVQIGFWSAMLTTVWTLWFIAAFAPYMANLPEWSGIEGFVARAGVTPPRSGSGGPYQERLAHLADRVVSAIYTEWNLKCSAL